VLVVLAAAVGLQYYLIHVPITDLSQTTKFSPAIATAGVTVVTLTNPATDPDSFNFDFNQPAQSATERMVVDAYFDHAALSNETIQKLGVFGVHPPSEAAAIRYLTFAKHNGTCNTAFHVTTSQEETTGQVSQARTVDLWQSEPAPSVRHRSLDLKLTGLDSAVTLSSQGTFGADGRSACEITLRVGEWEQKTGGFVPVTVKVPAGSGYRFQWEAVEVQPYLAFGKARRQSFHADEVAVHSAQVPDKGVGRDGLFARCEHKNAPLSVDSLVIGTDKLQLRASGEGRARENGTAITANWIDTITKNPLVAVLFGALNVGLLNWAKARFFPPVRPTPAPVIPLPKEETSSKAG